jgi:hypothetical protein
VAQSQRSHRGRAKPVQASAYHRLIILQVRAYLAAALGEEQLLRASAALCRPPLRTCVRVNTLRADPEEVARQLQAEVDRQDACGSGAGPVGLGAAGAGGGGGGTTPGSGRAGGSGTVRPAPDRPAARRRRRRSRHAASAAPAPRDVRTDTTVRFHAAIHPPVSSDLVCMVRVGGALPASPRGRWYTPAPAGARSPRCARVPQPSGGPGSPLTRS